MRYEVRAQSGELLGTLRGHVLPPQGGRMLLSASAPLSQRAISPSTNLMNHPNLSSLRTYTVGLSHDFISWYGRTVPILVLTSGKKSWLKRVKGFRGA